MPIDTKKRPRAGSERPEVKDSILLQLVSTALAQERPGGISTILGSIARSLDAYGCILWEMEPAGEVEGGEDLLYVLAEWFENGVSCSVHDLPVDGSLVGLAIREGKPQSSDDILRDRRIFPGGSTSFLEENSICCMYSLPVEFLDGTPGVLSLYRQECRPFKEDEAKFLNPIAPLIPGLYQTVLDKANARLLQSINRILDLAEATVASSVDKQALGKVLRKACFLVADVFGCMEVTLFLEDEWERPGVFELIATTWEERQPWMAPCHRADDEEGLTVWTLQTGKDLRIFDLKDFERDRESLEAKYPGLRWSDQDRVVSQMGELLGVSDEESLPPFSFMCSPIKAGERILGAIYCFGSSGHGPHFFAAREQALLSLVAQQIGQRWLNWLGRRNLQDENRSWKELVESVSQLNTFVHEELRKETLDEQKIFEKALEVTQSVIQRAEITDVRLVDSENNQLYFAVVHGDSWGQGDETTIKERMTRRFDLDDSQSSAGAHVYHTNKVYQVDDVEEPDIPYDPTFPDTRKLIVAPISVKDEVFGVLDIRSTADQELPLHAEAIAELLGKQLGLYHYLATTILQLQDAQAELATNIETQQHAIEDLTHQLRNPLIQAHERIQRVLGEIPSDKQDRRLRAVRGITAKALRVAQSTRLYVDLARERPIQAKLEAISADWLFYLLIEAAEDAEILIDPKREIRFDVERRGFQQLSTEHGVRMDKRLIEQAITNLLDNAGKYGYSATRVIVSGGFTKTDRFQIRVANQGIQLASRDARSARTRGWRSDLATWTTQEGSGLGLWIVDNIMKAHNGELVIQPTNPEGWTQIRLLFEAQNR